MNENPSQNEKEITVSDLYLELNPKQQAEAEYHLLGYLDVVRRIFERITREQPELLTKLEKPANLKQKRNPSDYTDTSD